MLRLLPLLFVLSIFCTKLSAQWSWGFDTVYLNPAVPTSMDSIYLIHQETYHSGTGEIIYQITQQQDTIEILACQQVYSSANISTTRDTLNLGVLSAGIHTIKFWLHRGVHDTTSLNYWHCFVPQDTNYVSFDFPVSIGTGALPEVTKQRIQVFPNPVGVDPVQVQTEHPLEQVQLLNLQGQCLQTWEVPKTTTWELAMTPYPAGCYYLKLQTSKGVQTAQILKH